MKQNQNAIFFPRNFNRIIIKVNNNLSFSLNIIKKILCKYEIMKKLFKKNLYPFKKFKFKYQIIKNLNEIFVINYIFTIFETKFSEFILNCTFIENKIIDTTIVFLNFNVKSEHMFNNINITILNTFYNILSKINQALFKLCNYPLSNFSDHSFIIIKASINDVWDFITKWNFVKVIYKENLYKIEFLGNSQNEKSIIKCFFIINEKQFITEIYVNKCNKLNLIWDYFIEPISGNRYMEEIKFQFFKINECETYLSFENKFNEKVNLNTIYNLKNIKKTLFDSLKILERKC